MLNGYRRSYSRIVFPGLAQAKSCCCNDLDKSQGESMKTTVVALSLMSLMVLPAFGQYKEADRVKSAGTVIS